jgi:hypothetical protein
MQKLGEIFLTVRSKKKSYSVSVMTKKIKTLDQAPVDVVEAVKRGFIHRGFIPRKYKRNDPLSPEFILDNEEEAGGEFGPDQPKSRAGNKSKQSSGKTPKKQPSDGQSMSEGDSSDGGDSNDNGDGYEGKPIYKEDDDKQGQVKSSNKPDEKIGERQKGSKQEVEPQDGSGDHSGKKTVEDEQREEKPEGSEGGTGKDWPPQNLRNDITSTDPDISVIDSEIGSQEAAKDPDEPEPGETHEKLIDITEKAHDVLYEAETVFPFTPFPHTISIDREKLTIASRSFFRVAQILTVPLTSMISAEVSVGPFFGAVKMTSKYFVDNTHLVRYLWRHDAVEIHRLLQGYIIAHERDLEMHEIEKEDLKTLLTDLGQGVSD